MPRVRTLNPSPGDVFGNGTFLGETSIRTKGGYLVRTADMRCSCGETYTVQVWKLHEGYGRSCSDCRKRLNRIKKLRTELNQLTASF